MFICGHYKIFLILTPEWKIHIKFKRTSLLIVKYNSEKNEFSISITFLIKEKIINFLFRRNDRE